MKFFIVIGVLVVAVLLCEKFKSKLPTPIKELYALWEKFSHLLGTVMSFLILTVLWLVGFGIYGIAMKVITLPKRFTAEPESYWVKSTPRPADSMKHQF